MTAQFTRFVIEMTLAQAQSVFLPGKDADDDVRRLLKMPAIRKQIGKIPDEDLRYELDQYGAWSDRELSNRKANERRIVWIAGGDILENQSEDIEK